LQITAIIPSYNRYTLLKRAIESILAQTQSVDEIIVVDDGSTDQTQQIQTDFPNISYFYQKNRGVSSARNLGIHHAKNEWIAFLDSDDEWLPQKIKKQSMLHQTKDKVLMSYTAENWIRDAKQVKIPKKYRKIGEDAFVENLSYCNIAPSSVIISKDLLLEMECFDESLEVCEDYALWLKITSIHEIALVNEKLINKYAGHDEQLGFRKDMDIIRLQILKQLVKSIVDKSKILLIENEIIAKIKSKH